MIRGLLCVLANCITSSNVEERDTIKLSMDPAMVPNRVRVAAGSRVDCHPACFSIR